MSQNTGWTDTAEKDVLNWWFRATGMPTASDPSHIGLILTSATPIEAGTGATEPAVGAYARVSWDNTSGKWNAATGTNPAQIQNNGPITFTAATASWGEVDHWGYWKGTAGALLAFGALTTPKTINNGDTAEFADTAITFKLGDPGDTYT